MNRLHKKFSLYCYNTLEIWDLNCWDEGRERYYKTVYPVKTLINEGVKHFKNVGLMICSHGNPDYAKTGITIEWLHVTFI